MESSEYKLNQYPVTATNDKGERALCIVIENNEEKRYYKIIPFAVEKKK